MLVCSALNELSQDFFIELEEIIKGKTIFGATRVSKIPKILMKSRLRCIFSSKEIGLLVVRSSGILELLIPIVFPSFLIIA